MHIRMRTVLPSLLRMPQFCAGQHTQLPCLREPRRKVRGCHKVDDDSLVAGWNALHSRQILPGSVLRRVNGQTDLDSMGQDRRGQYANSSHAS